ncbi:MAG: GDSL-type esterase/lipase family protein [Gemmatimonadaceae bacterium]
MTNPKLSLLGLVLPLTGAVFALPAAAQSAASAPSSYLASVVRELQQAWPHNRTVTIASHGHSVPAGYARTPEVRMADAYPWLLHEALTARFPHAVINVTVTAIGGENSEKGASRFVADVLALRPDVVTIDYALNDRSIGLARAETAWRSMITACTARGIPVILLTPTGDLKAHLGDPNDPLNLHAAQVRRLAAEYGVGLVDSFALFQSYEQTHAGYGELMAQPNHPNRRGHELVAAQLLEWFPLPPAAR